VGKTLSTLVYPLEVTRRLALQLQLVEVTLAHMEQALALVVQVVEVEIQ
jgi:hypothetical protein